MKVRRIGWFGLWTDRFPETVEFFSSVLGLSTEYREDDFVMFNLPDADRDFVEVFGPAQSEEWPAPEMGSSIGFVVDDVVEAREELAASGADLVGEITWLISRPGYGWFNIRGPDGRIYSIVQGSHLTGANE